MRGNALTDNCLNFGINGNVRKCLQVRHNEHWIALSFGDDALDLVSFVHPRIDGL